MYCIFFHIIYYTMYIKYIVLNSILEYIYIFYLIFNII